MAALFAVLWLVGTIAGIWFLIAPKPSWPLVANRKRSAVFLAAAFIGLPTLSAVVSPPTLQPNGSVKSNAVPSSMNSVAQGSDVQRSVVAPSPAPESSPSKWSYDESKDEMRGTVTKYARLEGNEEFKNIFGFGGEHTQLELQKRSRGYDVALSNKNLQFICNSFSDTHMEAKFGNGPVTRFACTNAKGDKFGVAFLEPGSRFVEKLRSVKTLTIEAEIFQRGDVQMTFDVAGLSF